MIVDGNLEAHHKKYWIPRINPTKMSLEEAIEGTREHLLKSMEIRLRSDVPLAFA